MRNKTNLKISYDSEADIMSWEVKGKSKIDYATEMGDLIAHFTRNGKLVLIELLGASSILKKHKASFQKAFSGLQTILVR